VTISFSNNILRHGVRNKPVLSGETTKTCQNRLTEIQTQYFWIMKDEYYPLHCYVQKAELTIPIHHTVPKI